MESSINAEAAEANKAADASKANEATEATEATEETEATEDGYLLGGWLFMLGQGLWILGLSEESGLFC